MARYSCVTVPVREVEEYLKRLGGVREVTVATVEEVFERLFKEAVERVRKEVKREKEGGGVVFNLGAKISAAFTKLLVDRGIRYAAVTDEGPIMPAEQREKIFEELRRRGEELWRLIGEEGPFLHKCFVEYPWENYDPPPRPTGPGGHAAYPLLALALVLALKMLPPPGGVEVGKASKAA